MTGVELSDVAAETARNYISSLPHEICPHQDNYTILQGSFFDLNSEEKFDFVYDYTFLCALNPSIRSDWANKMSELIKPGGELLTLIFPIRELESDIPPFKVSLQLYRDLLEPVGFDCLQLVSTVPYIYFSCFTLYTINYNSRNYFLLNSLIKKEMVLRCLVSLLFLLHIVESVDGYVDDFSSICSYRRTIIAAKGPNVLMVL